jgi:hypothetical protein
MQRSLLTQALAVELPQWPNRWPQRPSCDCGGLVSPGYASFGISHNRGLAQFQTDGCAEGTFASNRYPLVAIHDFRSYSGYEKTAKPAAKAIDAARPWHALRERVSLTLSSRVSFNNILVRDDIVSA